MTSIQTVSPSRQYRMIMLSEVSEKVVRVVTLPDTLPNNSATAENWYQKHIPAGHLLVEVEPLEIIEQQMEKGLFEGFTPRQPTPDNPAGVPFNEQKKEKKDDPESFVRFEPITPPIVNGIAVEGLIEEDDDGSIADNESSEDSG